MWWRNLNKTHDPIGLDSDDSGDPPPPPPPRFPRFPDFTDGGRGKKREHGVVQPIRRARLQREPLLDSDSDFTDDEAFPKSTVNRDSGNIFAIPGDPIHSHGRVFNLHDRREPTTFRDSLEGLDRERREQIERSLQANHHSDWPQNYRIVKNPMGHSRQLGNLRYGMSPVPLARNEYEQDLDDSINYWKNPDSWEIPHPNLPKNVNEANLEKKYVYQIPSLEEIRANMNKIKTHFCRPYKRIFYENGAEWPRATYRNCNLCNACRLNYECSYPVREEDRFRENVLKNAHTPGHKFKIFLRSTCKYSRKYRRRRTTLEEFGITDDILAGLCRNREENVLFGSLETFRQLWKQGNFPWGGVQAEYDEETHPGAEGLHPGSQDSGFFMSFYDLGETRYICAILTVECWGPTSDDLKMTPSTTRGVEFEYPAWCKLAKQNFDNFIPSPYALFGAICGVNGSGLASKLIKLACEYLYNLGYVKYVGLFSIASISLRPQLDTIAKTTSGGKGGGWSYNGEEKITMQSDSKHKLRNFYKKHGFEDAMDPCDDKIKIKQRPTDFAVVDGGFYQHSDVQLATFVMSRKIRCYPNKIYTRGRQRIPQWFKLWDNISPPFHTKETFDEIHFVDLMTDNRKIKLNYYRNKSIETRVESDFFVDPPIGTREYDYKKTRLLNLAKHYIDRKNKKIGFFSVDYPKPFEYMPEDARMKINRHKGSWNLTWREGLSAIYRKMDDKVTFDADDIIFLRRFNDYITRYDVIPDRYDRYTPNKAAAPKDALEERLYNTRFKHIINHRLIVKENEKNPVKISRKKGVIQFMAPIFQTEKANHWKIFELDLKLNSHVIFDQVLQYIREKMEQDDFDTSGKVPLRRKTVVWRLNDNTAKIDDLKKTLEKYEKKLRDPGLGARKDPLFILNKEHEADIVHRFILNKDHEDDIVDTLKIEGYEEDSRALDIEKRIRMRDLDFVAPTGPNAASSWRKSNDINQNLKMFLDVQMALESEEATIKGTYRDGRIFGFRDRRVLDENTGLRESEYAAQLPYLVGIIEPRRADAEKFTAPRAFLKYEKSSDGMGFRFKEDDTGEYIEYIPGVEGKIRENQDSDEYAAQLSSLGDLENELGNGLFVVEFVHTHGLPYLAHI